MYSVEWNHNLVSGPWQAGWSNQYAIVTTQEVVTVPVPLFYRAAEGFDNRAFDGVWMVYHLDDGRTEANYLKCDGRGLVTAMGTFMEGHPIGHYTVHTNGTFDMVLYEMHSDVISLSGHRRDAQTWEYVYEGLTDVIRRVASPDALAGAWRGTIGPYTNVYLGIRPDGYIPVISNLIDVSTGSAYVDASNVSAFFWTGADVTNGWDRFMINATLIGTTNILGDYMLDSEDDWVTAGVNLRKQ